MLEVWKFVQRASNNNTDAIVSKKQVEFRERVHRAVRKAQAIVIDVQYMLI